MRRYGLLNKVLLKFSVFFLLSIFNIARVLLLSQKYVKNRMPCKVVFCTDLNLGIMHISLPLASPQAEMLLDRDSLAL